MDTLKIEDLSFEYTHNYKIISNLNVTFKVGQTYLLDGPSGVGKSTLASLIAGHLSPLGGNIYLQDQKIKGPTRKVIVVHQENDLFPWLTVRGHLDFLKLSELGLNIDKKYDFHDELKMFNLLEASGQYPVQISGGMKRRLAILRALLLRPTVLILDESMSSLDKKLKIEIMCEVKVLTKKNGILLILIDHNAQDLMKFVDQRIELQLVGVR